MPSETKAPSTTGYMWDERLMWHNTGMAGGVLEAGGWIQPYGHNEHPDAKRRCHNLLDACGLLGRLTLVPSREASFEELRLVHDADYLHRIEALSRGHGGDAGLFTPVGRDSYPIAARAVGGLLNAVDMVVSGQIRNAYALVRPPGHHAVADRGIGGCIFANVAIAAAHARASHGLDRIAVVDFDAHHGNGTQESFYDDPHVLAISIHQERWYTLLGDPDERGEGAGLGATINIPLPGGSGRGAYEAAFDEIVLPALGVYRPQLILVASGFDAGAFDHTSSLILGSDGFRAIAARLVSAADALCGGRIIFSHEGGYNPWATPFSFLAVMEALSGLESGVEDPFLPFVVDSPDQQLQPHQAAAVRRARDAVLLR